MSSTIAPWPEKAITARSLPPPWAMFACSRPSAVRMPPRVALVFSSTCGSTSA